METPSQELINVVVGNPSLREALKQIRGFKVMVVNQLSKTALEILDENGFDFSSSYVTQRRNDVKSFVLSHPEVMADDSEILIDNIICFLNLTENERTQRMRRADERLRKKYGKKPAKKKQEESEDPDKDMDIPIIEISDSSSDENHEEEEEVKEIKKAPKKSSKK